jgi:hypothetical protein
MRRSLLLALSVAALAGCGGDDSDDSGDAGDQTSSEAVAEELGDGVVASVEGRGDITEAEFDRALVIAAKEIGDGDVPPPGSPKYDEVSASALNQLLDVEWILGEGEERGIAVARGEIRREFEQTKSENFKTEAEYQKFLRDSGFNQAEIYQRVELQLISTRIQDEVSVAEGGDDPSGMAAQRAFDAFLAEYREKWRQRTTCAPALASERCVNGPEPAPDARIAPSRTDGPGL